MYINPLFNPSAHNSRTIFEGKATGLCQLNNIARPWAYKLYQQMRSQFWIPEKIDLTQDVNDYQNLTPFERRAYNKILGFLVFLDSIQINNLSYIKRPISSPEVNICLVEQTSQEALHSQSYQVLIETIIPKSERDSIYELWREDKVLRARCELIASKYQAYIDDGSLTSYLNALIADYILEGMYFYCGFMFFYTLATRSLMPGTADIIKLIHRDELSHVRLHQNLIIEAKNQYPKETADLWSDNNLQDIFLEASDNEKDWNSHVCGGNILGITEQSTQDYIDYLTETRCKAIGFKNIVKGNKPIYNPYQHLERFADVEDKGHTKSNFFEAIPSYTINNDQETWNF
jgi:ribonucleoside-diphosphate reductase beta chain